MRNRAAFIPVLALASLAACAPTPSPGVRLLSWAGEPRTFDNSTPISAPPSEVCEWVMPWTKAEPPGQDTPKPRDPLPGLDCGCYGIYSQSWTEAVEAFNDCIAENVNPADCLDIFLQAIEDIEAAYVACWTACAFGNPTEVSNGRAH